MRFLFCYTYGWFEEILFSDLFSRDDVDAYAVNRPTSSRMVDFLRRVHKSPRINHRIRLPLRRIWDDQLVKRVHPDTCMIFLTSSVSYLAPELVKSLRERFPKNPMVLLIIDSLHADSVHLHYVRDRLFSIRWDLVLSFDRRDCAEYGFTFMGYAYYSVPRDVRPSKQEADLYYIGSDKGGRMSLVESVYEAARAQGIRCNFQISGKTWHPQDRQGVELHRRWISYDKAFADVQSANCILEVLQQHQHQQSVRYFEAVCCNKKLLTNNPNVTELPYYDARYMRYFQTPEDIDMDWVRAKESIDYGYRGDFSPVGLLETIRESLEGSSRDMKNLRDDDSQEPRS